MLWTDYIGENATLYSCPQGRVTRLYKWPGYKAITGQCMALKSLIRLGYLDQRQAVYIVTLIHQQFVAYFCWMISLLANAVSSSRARPQAVPSLIMLHTEMRLSCTCIHIYTPSSCNIVLNQAFGSTVSIASTSTGNIVCMSHVCILTSGSFQVCNYNTVWYCFQSTW